MPFGCKIGDMQMINYDWFRIYWRGYLRWFHRLCLQGCLGMSWFHVCVERVWIERHCRATNTHNPQYFDMKLILYINAMPTKRHDQRVTKHVFILQSSIRLLLSRVSLKLCLKILHLLFDSYPIRCSWNQLLKYQIHSCLYKTLL